MGVKPSFGARCVIPATANKLWLVAVSLYDKLRRTYYFALRSPFYAQLGRHELLFRSKEDIRHHFAGRKAGHHFQDDRTSDRLIGAVTDSYTLCFFCIRGHLSVRDICVT